MMGLITIFIAVVIVLCMIIVVPASLVAFAVGAAQFVCFWTIADAACWMITRRHIVWFIGRLFNKDRDDD